MLVFPLIFLIFLPSVFAEQIPDYDNPYSPIFTDKSVYSWTDKVKMTILAPSWNTDRYLIDSIGGDGEIDTSPRTIGNGPTSGFLEVDRDSAITISFEFADGVVLTESIPVQWNIGKIQFSEENYLSDNTALIHAIDSDLNLNPESLDHMPIQISSTSDISGIEVDAIETSESSGIFTATISFTQNLSSSGNRLFVTSGDTNRRF